jgi:hypothetical protein
LVFMIPYRRQDSLSEQRGNLGVIRVAHDNIMDLSDELPRFLGSLFLED